MANYLGVHCPICDKKFTGEDDIVVCPVCGAPHHRACYQKEGHCAFEERHVKGHVWTRTEDASSGTGTQWGAQTRSCPSCGADNPDGGLFCQVCGTPLRKSSGPAANGQWQWQPPRQGQPNPYAESNAYNASFGGLSPDDQINGVSVRDLSLYIGPNSQYYLPRFKQLADHTGFSFNFAAFLLHFVYFFYRKMYLMGTLLLVLAAAMFVPALFIAQEYTAFVMENFADISVGIMPVFEPSKHLWAYQVLPYARMAMLIVMFLLAAFSNKLYMSHVFRQIRKIQAGFGSAPEDKAYTDSLVRRGRTSRAAAALCIAGAAAGYFGSCLLIALTVLAG